MQGFESRSIGSARFFEATGQDRLRLGGLGPRLTHRHVDVAVHVLSYDRGETSGGVGSVAGLTLELLPDQPA